MEIVEFLGYFGALFIGIVLGLIGGGGSILTIPVLVYLMHINPISATAYSLFIVGVSALIGSLKNIRNRMISLRTAIIFATPAFIAVYSTRKYMVPAIPDIIFEVKDFIVTKEIAIMVFFAVIMLLASVSMIKNRKKDVSQKENIKYNYVLIIIEGLIVGIITGIVGAGGGFLIIPALVLFAKLPMKKAVATSLLIIAIKSLVGFIGDMQIMHIEWNFLLIFAAISIIGIFIGTYLTNFIEGKKLEKGFGWFVLGMGLFIILKELY
ncbi:sulfite exporter TauE/SafE family protein [Aquimarina sp. AU474]|uniref:sulfite exporter TauE/SafE family protein n=1 Tax=Aquimarina sp. AU474 TaxID=2108529 RepID=UPI000D6855DA|nr:sulfite exporter TauE/SafE family protein [Aquimarina sp. AU474]